MGKDDQKKSCKDKKKNATKKSAEGGVKQGQGAGTANDGGKWQG